MSKYNRDARDNQSWRQSKDYKKWKAKALRYQKCCQICGETEDLNVHHLFCSSYHPEKRYLYSNAKVLCKSCHMIFHCDYKAGYRVKTTKHDFEEFKKIALHFIEVGKRE